MREALGVTTCARVHPVVVHLLDREWHTSLLAWTSYRCLSIETPHLPGCVGAVVHCLACRVAALVYATTSATEWQTLCHGSSGTPYCVVYHAPFGLWGAPFAPFAVLHLDFQDHPSPVLGEKNSNRESMLVLVQPHGVY